MKSHIASIFLIALVAQAQSSLSGITQLCSPCERVDACHNACISGSELIYDAPTGAACSTGGAQYQIWTMTYDGSNKTLRSTSAGLSGFLLNQGDAVWSPDGSWVVLQTQTAASTLACSSNDANPGVGIDQDVTICKSDFSACTQMTSVIHGLSTGSLHPYFDNELGYVFWLHVAGIGNNNIGQWGSIRRAAVTFPGSVPTFGAAVDDCPLSGTCSGAHDWYEPAYYTPGTNCLSYITSGTQYNTIAIYSWNVCTRSGWTAVTPQGLYTEFWTPDSSVTNCLGSSTQFTSIPSPNGKPFAAPPKGLDMTISPCNSVAAWQPLTYYNNPLYINGIAAVSHPAWKVDNSSVYFTLQSTALGTGVNYIYGATISGTPTFAPFVQPGQSTQGNQ